MVSRYLIGATCVALAVSAVAALHGTFREATVVVPAVEGRTTALIGTSLNYATPSGWNVADHSSCVQPCVRMRLSTNGEITEGPSITLQRVPRTEGAATPYEYAQGYLERISEQTTRTPVERVRIGSREGVQFNLVGSGIADSFDTARSFKFESASRHIVFEAERMLYECVIEGSPSDVEAYLSVFLSVCGSVREA